MMGRLFPASVSEQSNRSLDQLTFHLVLALQLIDGYSSRKRKWRLSSFQAKNCADPDDVHLASRHCCRVCAADKGWRVYPLDPRPVAVELYSGGTTGKRHAWVLPADRPTASLVGLRVGWRHARTNYVHAYGSNAAIPGGSERCHLPEDQAQQTPRQTSHREDRHIVRNACVQLTASSAAIQAQLGPSLVAPVSSNTIRMNHSARRTFGVTPPITCAAFNTHPSTPLFGVVPRTRKLVYGGMEPGRLLRRIQIQSQQ
ncbi:hypothetical protein TNCV_3281071 [Trichonephila clavipes]|nr:hypothetical protein TNCV_3281071 [Trichonephila clavipes]